MNEMNVAGHNYVAGIGDQLGNLGGFAGQSAGLVLQKSPPLDARRQRLREMVWEMTQPPTNPQFRGIVQQLLSLDDAGQPLPDGESTLGTGLDILTALTKSEGERSEASMFLVRAVTYQDIQMLQPARLTVGFALAALTLSDRMFQLATELLPRPNERQLARIGLGIALGCIAAGWPAGLFLMESLSASGKWTTSNPLRTASLCMAIAARQEDCFEAIVRSNPSSEKAAPFESPQRMYQGMNMVVLVASAGMADSLALILNLIDAESELEPSAATNQSDAAAAAGGGGRATTAEKEAAYKQGTLTMEEALAGVEALGHSLDAAMRQPASPKSPKRACLTSPGSQFVRDRLLRGETASQIALAAVRGGPGVWSQVPRLLRLGMPLPAPTPLATCCGTALPAEEEAIASLLRAVDPVALASSHVSTVAHALCKEPGVVRLRLLHVALERSEGDLVHAALPNPDGATPLAIAASADFVDAMRLLRQHGANPFAGDSRGRTPLHLAVQNRARASVRFLIDWQPALLTIPDRSGRTALHHAATCSREDIMRDLLGYLGVLPAPEVAEAAVAAVCEAVSAHASSVATELEALKAEIDTLSRRNQRVQARQAADDQSAEEVSAVRRKQRIEVLKQRGRARESQTLLAAAVKSIEPKPYATAQLGRVAGVRPLLDAEAGFRHLLQRTRGEKSVRGTALHIAASEASIRTVALFIHVGSLPGAPRLDIPNLDGFTPVEVAILGARQQASSTKTPAFLVIADLLSEAGHMIAFEPIGKRAPSLALSAEEVRHRLGRRHQEAHRRDSDALHEAPHFLCHAGHGSPYALSACMRAIKADRSLISRPLARDGSLMLHIAAFNGSEELVRRLLAMGANPNVKAQDKSTPLIGAAFRGHMGVVRLLIQAGCDLTTRRQTGENVLHFVVRWLSDEALAVLRLVMRKQPELLCQAAEGGLNATPLHTAAYAGNTAAVRLMLVAGQKVELAVDAVAANGATPLYSACHRGHEDTALELLKAGANPAFDGGEPPVHVAAAKGLTHALNFMLLQSKCNPNLRRERDGTTLLHRAAYQGEWQAVRVLLRCGADLHLQAQGSPPLVSAAYKGRNNTVVTLINGGAVVDQQVVQLCRQGAAAERRGRTLLFPGKPLENWLADCLEDREAALAAVQQHHPYLFPWHQRRKVVMWRLPARRKYLRKR